MSTIAILAIILFIVLYIILGIRECLPRLEYALVAASIYGISPFTKLLMVILLLLSFLLWPIAKLAVIGYNFYQKVKK